MGLKILSSRIPRVSRDGIPHRNGRSRWRSASTLARDLAGIDAHIREGRFQRSLSLLAGLSSILAGVEVAYEHYKGSYGQRIMYTPVILSSALAGAGIWGSLNRWAARTVLRVVSALTLLDSVIGFLFHLRGIQRKPGGWRLPVVNIVMGPPVFAPLLFGVSAYLGFIASFLRPEEMAPSAGLFKRRSPYAEVSRAILGTPGLREGRFQKHLATVTLLGTFFSGFEALYSHYKNNFRYKAQWTPVIIAPLLMAAAAGAIRDSKTARTWLPLMSVCAIADGAVGFFYHARGVLRRPGGQKTLLYNVIYGPPLFAPLLFAACGAVGLLASLMQRETP
jgi:hypothetical protein